MYIIMKELALDLTIKRALLKHTSFYDVNNDCHPILHVVHAAVIHPGTL